MWPSPATCASPVGLLLGIAMTHCCVWPAGCESSTVWLPTRGLLAPRWVFTYKNGLSSGHNGCYGRVSAPCSELGFVCLFDSINKTVQQASWGVWPVKHRAQGLNKA